MNIYSIVSSVSYDIFGEQRIISYHSSEEGAYIKMDEIAEQEGFNKEDIKTYTHTDEYIYSNDNRSLYVEVIKVEE